MLHGFATPDGTRRYAEQFPAARSNGFYTITNDLSLASLGFGTCVGDPNAAPDVNRDAAEENAVLEALRLGINFLDTSLSYREQRAERALGTGLRVALNANSIQRDQFFMCTKAGYLTPGAIPEALQEEDVAGGLHSLQPDFLEDQLNRSRANLELDTIDVFYLQDPEVQLPLRDARGLRAKAASGVRAV